MSVGDGRCYFAYPGANLGEIALFDVSMLNPCTVIKAHNAGIAAVAINSAGTLMATASSKVHYWPKYS